MAVAAGQQLGQYEVLDCLGVGGMGEVYRARDVRLGREVALKVIRPGRDGEADFLSRFDREARLLAALNHPHIATLYDVQEADGIRFLVMELVEGQSLSEVLRGGPLPPEEALVLARQLAEALEAAHARGIVHRDLKPANLKLTAQRRLKVLDFGLGKFVARPASEPTACDATTDDVILSEAEVSCQTSAGVILGTPTYMSPEQARGQPVDSRADVWAFGCVLFEMLTGRRPFSGPTLADTLAAVLEREPDWSLLPASTPAPILDTLRRCLRKDPERRLRDIRDVRIEIEEGSVLLTRLPSAPFVAPAVASAVAPAVASGTLDTLPVLRPADSATRVSPPPLPTLPPSAPPLPPPGLSSSRVWLRVSLGVLSVSLAAGITIFLITRSATPPPPPEPDPFKLMNDFQEKSFEMMEKFMGKMPGPGMLPKW